MNILIIDDHPLYIEGISYLLKQLSDDVNILKAVTIPDAITHLEANTDFDLILLDLDLPEMDGFSLLERFSANELCMPLVIVSAEEKAGLIQRALSWGAMGFMPKSFSPTEMLDAFREILEGNIFIPENIQVLISRLPSEKNAKNLTEALQQTGISKKQFEVLKLISKGYSNQKIAVTLNRTEHTVKSHISALFQLLHVNNRTECVKVARDRGLIGLSDNH